MAPTAADTEPAGETVAGMRLPLDITPHARSAFARFKHDSADISEAVETDTFMHSALFAEHAWSQDLDIGAAIFTAFEEQYCTGQDNIHTCVGALEDSRQAEDVLRAYYAARAKYYRHHRKPAVPLPTPALLSNPEHRVLAMFGGQGGMDNYMDEMRAVFSVYRPLLADYVTCMSQFLANEAADPPLVHQYQHGLDVIHWIEVPEETPEQNYMLSVPVCLPLVGLTQIMQVMVLFKTLGTSPAGLADRFSWMTGHSQGITTAAVLSLATTEESFYSVSKVALGLLMLGGVFPQFDYPLVTPSSPSAPSSSEANGTIPTPMATVLKVSRSELQGVITRYNAQQDSDSMHVYLSLTNSSRMHVVSGAVASVSKFVRVLEQEFDTVGTTDQTRVPFSRRRPRAHVKYLSINGPYHCRLLQHAYEGACEYAVKKGWILDGARLRRPLKTYEDGRDIRGISNLSCYLLKCMLVIPVDWPAAMRCPGVTHVVDFGPGGVSGFGALVHRIFEGQGVLTVCAGAFDDYKGPMAAKYELYKQDPKQLRQVISWAREYRPRLVRSAADNQLHIDTPMSRLLGKPPVMVAGMTPSTISEVFVSAVMRAGYHVELSGGGHFSEPMLRDKVDKILKLVDPGLGVSINSIYINPFLWNIQYPAMQLMRREGVPMEGLCIGAGVPSFDVTNEIIANIREVGFRHIGLKPSSVSTIRLVIKIAQANPDFPILLQWTGGRAGGHHSFEDFHQPILETYGSIRAQKNIVLVAGSGFGGVDDTLPYLTGDWSRRFDCAPMPFDGCLFGSRVMVAKEGAASDSVKEAIVAAPGIDDSEWEKTYQGPAGGIVTVLSELGEPIHKIATRGVMLWKELDDTVFSLPRDKRLPALLAKKEYIIKRLNDDFQKPWFGKKADGSTADLEEMTYAEVANRLVEVLYVKHQSRWIDVTMRNLVGDFLLRLEERFAGRESTAVLQSFTQINEPFAEVKHLLDSYPESYTQLLASEDVQFFINLCLRPGQKPVPFIPLMDKDFHIWFKKDSLWQAEDVDAVAGQDVGRVCILQGPVAVRYATKANEPVKDILDTIYHGQIKALLERYHEGDESQVPTVGFVGNTPVVPATPAHVRVKMSDTQRVYILPRGKAQLPAEDAWLEYLAGNELSWLTAFLTAPIVVQDRTYVSNIARRVLRPRLGQVVRVALKDGQPERVDIIDGSGSKALGFGIGPDKVIWFNMYSAPRGTECTLELRFRYQAHMPYAPIHEVMEGRNERIKKFYAQVWFENSQAVEAATQPSNPKAVFVGSPISVDRLGIEEFCRAIGNISDRYIPSIGGSAVAPLDFAMRVFWPALAKCLMSPVCNGDLTALVHLTNSFRVVSREPMCPGQTLSSEARISEVIDTSSGRTVGVRGHILRGSLPIIAVETSFVFRGQFPDYSCNFRHVREEPIQLLVADAALLALLNAREWFVPAGNMNHHICVGATLRFELESQYQYKSPDVYSHIVTCGTALVLDGVSEWVKVADIDFESIDAFDNSALQFLLRNGQPVHKKMAPYGDYELAASTVKVPDSNQRYSHASTDHNPIHTNAYFADLVQLPTTITHGMWTSAAARKCVEDSVALGQPERVVAYSASFIDMVSPGSTLTTRISRAGISNGRMVVHVQSAVGDRKVLDGTAEVEISPTAFLFTGQGAHAIGMGMDLYASSQAARRVWDTADVFMREKYGIPLLSIVRSNPVQHTVNFVGRRGQRIRESYLLLASRLDNSSPATHHQLLAGITADAESFTFHSPHGLLYATQFTQAAMLVCEIAEFTHLHSMGVVPDHSAFAGHSLGEYAGLAALGGVFSAETAVEIGFCRGLIMQQSVKRDYLGRSGYGMLAVNPSRVSGWFTSADLDGCVEAISACSGSGRLLEIANYNVRDTQLVVSGELVLLDALTLLLSDLGSKEMVPASLDTLAIHACAIAYGRKDPAGHQLQRTAATVPLSGIDVPFHSTLLQRGADAFRKVLQSSINIRDVNPQRLCRRYIPNLTARPFDTSCEYIAHVQELTGSASLAYLLDSLDKNRIDNDAKYEQSVAYTLLVEILCHQFSSPVRWIETQDVLLDELRFKRFVEVGPSGILANMLRRTLSHPPNARSSGWNGLRAEDVEILCTASDMPAILLDDEKSSPPTGTAAPDKAKGDEQAGQAAVPKPIPDNSQQKTLLPPPAVAGQATAVPEAPIEPLKVVQALVAYKLKLRLDAVPGSTTIKHLVGGKSTLQNEIIGDLQKEFAGDFPDRSEETPLLELSQDLTAGDSLGKVSQGLVSRMLTSKMPGGFTRSLIGKYLEETYGLGPLRQQALLLMALTMEPSARLESVDSAKRWLANAAEIYAQLAEIHYTSLSGPSSTGQGGSGSASSSVTVINSEQFDQAQQAQLLLSRRTIHALAAYLGVDIVDPSDKSSSGADASLERELADLQVWNGEYGQDFCEKIRPTFSALKARRFDSFWNWGRQDLVELYHDIIGGRITKIDLGMSSHCLHLVNRVTPELVDILRFIVQRSEQGRTPGHLLAYKYGTALIARCKQRVHAPTPTYQFTQQPLAPRLCIGLAGKLEYFEASRSGEATARSYVDAVFSTCDRADIPNCYGNGSMLDTVLEKLCLPSFDTSCGKSTVPSALPPMVHLRSRGPDSWCYDQEKSAVYRAVMHGICDNGLSLKGKIALVTGCGRGSIGAEIVKGLLEAGVQVIATTSSYSMATTRYFQAIYQRHGARGSALIVVPFNQASRQDVVQLVDYIYRSEKAKGLGWDLDFVVPFAAIPELGHDLTELDSNSELSHRAMLTNVMRLVGEIASQKVKQRLDMHPTMAILPLSPNHGAFGYDGHYSESKIGLETLLNRWHAEPTWGDYVTVAGAVIGWTRGTGLMSGNNVVAEYVERSGVRTFTAAEIAFSILGLMHSRVYAMAAMEPIWADMSGRFQYYPKVSQAVLGMHRSFAQMRSVLKASMADSVADFGLVADESTERVYKLHTLEQRANHKFKFPTIKSYEQLEHLHHLQGMVNLDKVVVITGYGEVGPYGNAETRWEMEAFGEFSLEGCIELAWIMGLIKHFNGKHKKAGKVYTGWVDAQTEEPVADRDVKSRYEKRILEHTGIRLIEPEGIFGYNPLKKSMMREVQIEHDMEPFEATEEEAQQFKYHNQDRVSILEAADGSWKVRLLKGATLMVPKALRFDRLVAAQLPTGWSPERYGIPKTIADQVDPITCYALVATVEALTRSGITDPYEIYRYVHVSEVGSSTGTAVGGLRSAKRVFGERLCDRDQAPDVYQETFLSTPPAWINMLLMSSSGPIKTTIGACATGIASIDVAVDTIQSGKAKVMLAGGTDGICEESSYEFAQMNATSSTVDEFQKGRSPAEMSRPCTSSRNGFMESEGAGVVVLMSAATAIEMGAPIHGIVAMTGTATDKEGRSVPAPGQGVLTSARESASAQPSRLLDMGYRRRQLELRLAQIHEWADVEKGTSPDLSDEAFIDSEAERQSGEALDLWGNSFWKRNPSIAPLRGSLAVWGLTIDDIGLASFHGTSTKANDKNESEIIEQQLRHLGRTRGNVIPAVCQKYLTGHPKGPASIWMLNGVLQSLRTGIIPGNRNADNIAAELEQYQYIMYPSRSIQTDGIKAGLLKSFGFGQVGAECLLVHPDYLFAVLSRQCLDEYRAKVCAREAASYRHWHDTLTGTHPFVRVKDAPPYTADEEAAVYLDPLKRAGFTA
ncbi:fatty acid synthase alpha subunit Lsd1 [Coemansia sp. RSA 552]|nr:fatty acid synthase alpha subunit Lsd1 [Coemansia sp. RSA 552]